MKKNDCYENERHTVTLDRDKVIISPAGELAEYVTIRAGGKRPNTRLKYAQTLSRFMADHDYSEITTDYVTEYLTKRATSGITKATYDAEVRLVMSFVEFLEKRKTIKPIDYDKLRALPAASERVSTKINDIRPEFLSLFLETAIEYQPRIAFAILLSMAGGLRAGEVLNLTKADISCVGPWGKDGWVINITDRKMREKWTLYVKRTRRQRAQSMGALGAKIYKDHITQYTNPDEPALFVDENGNAMTYQAYYFRLKRVQKRFIEKLINSENPEAIAYGQWLSTRRWSTHIGRGIFSNDAARNTNNIAELAGARGDLSPGSSIPYIQAGATERIGHLQELMAEELLENAERK